MQIKRSKDECIKSALIYNHKVDWINAAKLYYRTAQRHGWIEECCKHMTPAPYTQEHKDNIAKGHLGSKRSASAKTAISQGHIGEKNYSAKITNEEAINIRKKYSTGKFTQSELAEEFKMHQCNISRIVNKKRFNL